MDKKKITWIIAREGLIILVIALTSMITYVAFIFIFNLRLNPASQYHYILPRIIDRAVSITSIGYPIYLLSRFIFWVIKKPKDK